MARGDVRAALIVMQSAQLIAPGHAAVLNGLGNALRAVGDARGARNAYEAASPGGPGLSRRLAQPGRRRTGTGPTRGNASASRA